MIGLILAAALAPLTPDQKADLGCLTISATLADGARPDDDMAQFFLARLKRTDTRRDWLSEAKPLNDIDYLDVMDRLDTCRARMAAGADR